tara:strand:+ start:381 stop:764 length:384 start_codon:yes stop_codon:yes gene_type:complete
MRVSTAIVILTILKEGKNKMTIYLREQIRQLGDIILSTQKTKGDNRRAVVHTTAGMNSREELDQSLEKLIDRLKELKDNLIGENLRIQSQLWQVNCYMQDAIKRNNAIMAEDIAKWEFTKRGGKKNA